MRLLLWAVSLFVLFAGPVYAGENRHLGVITVSGASLTNVTTAVPFIIPVNAYLTISCSAAVQMLTDSTVVSTATTGTKGIALAATTLFPTSVGQARASIGNTPTAVIAVIGTGACDVWQRLGTE